jgi:hypothetical protein
MGFDSRVKTIINYIVFIIIISYGLMFKESFELIECGFNYYIWYSKADGCGRRINFLLCRWF